MFTDRDGNLTDDADRDATGTMSEFGPNDGYDPMYEGPGGAPKCARESNDWRGCICDYDGQLIPGHPGCKHCNPPDYECKPHGFGIDRYDPQYDEARKWMWSLAGALRVHTFEQRQALFTELAVADGFSPRLERLSERLWDRLCDTCETHSEAKEKYTKWAKRKTSKNKESRNAR